MSVGILLVATGEKYVQEAIPLVESIRLHMSDIPIHVVTDVETNIPDNLFDEVDRADVDFSDIPADKRGFMFRDYALTRSKFDRTVHIYTDTYIGTSLYEVFHGLSRFELIVGAAPARVDSYGDSSIPYSKQDPGSYLVIPRINCGFIAYTRKLVEKEFFEKWINLYRMGIEAAERRNRPKYSDQSEFRKLLWNSDVNFQIMPPEFNFRTGAPQYLDGHVRIAHGRPPMGRENLMAFINSFTGRRLYVPYKELIFQSENGDWESISYDEWHEQEKNNTCHRKIAVA